MEGNKVQNFLRKYMMLIIMVLVIIAFAIITGGKTLIPQNINNVISQNGYVFVLGTGMLLCILTGGNIDLSVGSTVCLAGGVGAIMLEKGMPWPIAVITMIIFGILIGMWNGFWIAYVNVPPFIATLVGWMAFRGIANLIMGGMAYTISDSQFLMIFGGGDKCYVTDLLQSIGLPTPAPTDLAPIKATIEFQKFLPAALAKRIPNLVIDIKGGPSDTICLWAGAIIALGYVAFVIINRVRLIQKKYKVDSLVSVIVKTVLIALVILGLSNLLARHNGIPTVLIWIALVLGIFTYITTKTTLGRNLYAVGGNEKATRLSGIDTKKVMFKAYTLMGLLAGFAGILNIARFVGSQPTYGQGYEMDAIAACFIGGASAYGGTGSVGGVIIGAALMGIINQGMVVAKTPANYQTVVKGIVLVLAVFFDVLMQMRRKGSKKKKAKDTEIPVTESVEGGAEA